MWKSHPIILFAKSFTWEQLRVFAIKRVSAFGYFALVFAYLVWCIRGWEQMNFQLDLYNMWGRNYKVHINTWILCFHGIPMLVSFRIFPKILLFGLCVNTMTLVVLFPELLISPTKWISCWLYYNFVCEEFDMFEVYMLAWIG